RQTQTSGQRKRFDLLRRHEEGTLHAARDRAGSRRRPRHAGVFVRSVSRRSSTGRKRTNANSRGAQVSSAASAAEGCSVSAGEKRWHAGDGAGYLPSAKEKHERVLRRKGRHWPALSPTGRSGHAVLHYGRWAIAAG